MNSSTRSTNRLLPGLKSDQPRSLGAQFSGQSLEAIETIRHVSRSTPTEVLRVLVDVGAGLKDRKAIAHLVYPEGSDTTPCRLTQSINGHVERLAAEGTATPFGRLMVAKSAEVSDAWFEGGKVMIEGTAAFDALKEDGSLLPSLELGFTLSVDAWGEETLDLRLPSEDASHDAGQETARRANRKQAKPVTEGEGSAAE